MKGSVFVILHATRLESVRTAIICLSKLTGFAETLADSLSKRLGYGNADSNLIPMIEGTPVDYSLFCAITLGYLSGQCKWLCRDEPHFFGGPFAEILALRSTHRLMGFVNCLEYVAA
jgi:hypothetical protein